MSARSKRALRRAATIPMAIAVMAIAVVPFLPDAADDTVMAYGPGFLLTLIATAWALTGAGCSRRRGAPSPRLRVSESTGREVR